MPHCCPQKQQCVLTIWSGSTSAFQPLAGIRFRVGPNWATNSGIVIGVLAINLSSILKGTLGACPARATCRPGPWPAICAGRQDIHPDSGCRWEVDSECPTLVGRPSDLQCADATRMPPRSAGTLPVPYTRLLPYRTARRTAPAAGRYERTFKKEGRAM